MFSAELQTLEERLLKTALQFEMNAVDARDRQHLGRSLDSGLRRTLADAAASLHYLNDSRTGTSDSIFQSVLAVAAAFEAHVQRCREEETKKVCDAFFSTRSLYAELFCLQLASLAIAEAAGGPQNITLEEDKRAELEVFAGSVHGLAPLIDADLLARLHVLLTQLLAVMAVPDAAGSPREALARLAVLRPVLAAFVDDAIRMPSTFSARHLAPVKHAIWLLDLKDERYQWLFFILTCCSCVGCDSYEDDFRYRLRS
jgi:hypothetical protein